MLIPISLYGLYRQVKPACKKAITQIRKGASFFEAFHSDQMIDTAQVSGLLLLAGPEQNFGNTAHFQLFVPLSLITNDSFRKPFLPGTQDSIFEECLQAPWSTLLLFSANHYEWIATIERKQSFLKAAAQYWDIFYAEGRRYSRGLSTPSTLWEVPTMLAHTLACLEFPLPLWNQPLPANWSTILKQYAQQELPAKLRHS